MQKKGFTLIEIMIAVAIIGILAAIAIPAYQGYILKAKMEKIIVPMVAISSYLDYEISEGRSIAGKTLADLPAKIIAPVNTSGLIIDNGSTTATIVLAAPTANTYTITGTLTGYPSGSNWLKVDQNGAKTQAGKLNWSK